MLQIVQLAPEAVGLRKDVAKRRSMLLFQTLEYREPVLELLQPLGGRIDVRRIRSKEEREIFELRLDPVARLQVRDKSRVDRRELGDAFPDGPHSR